MAYLPKKQDEYGMPTVGRPVTATLFVSPDGDDSDGSSWANAYTTLTEALNAASTDENDLTAILLAPILTYYDINTAGDPTWAANVEILSPHRRWSVIKNTHASATSILKLTGKSSVTNLAFSQQGTVNGIIVTNSAFRIRKCGFNSLNCTGAVTGINIDGTLMTLQGGRVEDVRVVGNPTYTTGMIVNNVTYSDHNQVDMHGCLVGVDMLGSNTINNFFNDCDLGGCGTGIKIQAGVTSQHFYGINFHENTVNVSDVSMKDHHWNDINAELPITIEPSDLTGIEVSCGDEIYGTDTEIRAAVTSTKPFKVIGFTLSPSNEESTLIRFSADNGVTFFTESIFSSKKDKSSGSGTATDFIFNAGTRISASGHSPNAGRTVNVWLEIQEI